MKNNYSFYSATGTIRYTLTNDYMFKIVFQHEDILTEFLCSLLTLSRDEIQSIKINNPIIPGSHVTDKMYILDISILLNNSLRINIELQVKNYDDWPDRSLSYLCRNFDQLYRGEEYKSTKCVLHISILDFTLFPEYPEFYATYKLQNVKNNNIYNDKFQLNVLDLSQITLATDEDKACGLDKWAALFKATTWKEVKQLVKDNENFASVAQKIYDSNADEQIRRECEAREIHAILERRTQERLQELTEQLAVRDEQLAILQAELTKLKQEINKS